jgi:hypothetical protein
MVPGFDFLQGLVKNASAALPGFGQWVAPTLDPEELGKRIEELKTVQFWLEQNARIIGTTVQALEVQRMTLSTLKTMNVQAADLAQAFKLKDPVPPPAPAGHASPPAHPAPAAPRAAAPVPPAAPPAAAPAAPTSAAAPGTAIPGVVDPMQWWGALTEQFTQLAAQALKDGSVESAGQLAGAMVKNSAEAVGQAMQQAGRAQSAAAGQAAPKASPNAARTAPRTATKTTAKTAAKAAGAAAKRKPAQGPAGRAAKRKP